MLESGRPEVKIKLGGTDMPLVLLVLPVRKRSKAPKYLRRLFRVANQYVDLLRVYLDAGRISTAPTPSPRPTSAASEGAAGRTVCCRSSDADMGAVDNVKLVARPIVALGLRYGRSPVGPCGRQHRELPLPQCDGIWCPQD